MAAGSSSSSVFYILWKWEINKLMNKLKKERQTDRKKESKKVRK
jgi:hypothetical protein